MAVTVRLPVDVVAWWERRGLRAGSSGRRLIQEKLVEAARKDLVSDK